MKKYIFMFVLLIVLSTMSISQSGWQVQSTPAGSYFHSIYFLNQNTGWAAKEGMSNSVIIKTTNRGTNWIVLTDSLNSTISDICFLNETTGWLDGSSGGIRKTTNGGSNWFFVNCPECNNSDDFLGIQFLNENIGYAYGDMQIFKSTNSGINWVLIPMSFIVTRGQFLNSTTGWLAGLGAFTKTTNGGMNWTENNFVNEWTNDVFFINTNTGWIVSNAGGIFKTTNGGSNWTIQFRDSTKKFNDIVFTSVDTGWAIATSHINSIYKSFVLKTINSGQNWFYQQIPNISFLYEIFMINSKEGWIVGTTMLHTTDGGGNVSIKQISSKIPDFYKLEQNFPNPFNPSTNIGYQITKNSYVTLKVYNTLGREIETLVNENQLAGTFEVTFNASKYPSGIYYYRIKTDNFSDTRKMVLVK